MSSNHEPGSNTNIVGIPVEENSIVKRPEEKPKTFCTPWSETILTDAELDERLRQERYYLHKRSRNVRPYSKRSYERHSRACLARAAKVPEVGIFFVVNGEPLVLGFPGQRTRAIRATARIP